jgi:beta-lactamase regulating signal transducer with metallopeptidase domain
MTSLIVGMNALAARWADAMSAFVWQSTLLAAAVGFVCFGLRRQSPRVRYSIWLVLAAKLLLLPLWSVDVTLPQAFVPDEVPATSIAGIADEAPLSPSVAPSSRPAIARALAEPASALRGFAAASWQSWLFMAWAAVIGIEVGRNIRQLTGLRQLLAKARPVDHAIDALVRDCARTLELPTAPAVRLMDVDGSPLVCGLLRPVLLLPVTYADRFDPHSLRQVVLHELAHLRRRDLMTIWILHAMRTVYWFHPVAYWIAYRAGLERELACDQLAMSCSGASPAAYARTLIHAAGRGARPMALTAAGAVGLDGGRRLEN